MIIHDAKGKHPRALVRLAGWARRRRMLVQVVAMAGLFLLGAFSHRTGALDATRTAIGLGDRNVAMITQLARNPADAVGGRRSAARLPTLQIELGLLELAQIREKREQALGVGYLISDDEDFVPATLRLDDRRIRVRMRLKGDLTTHLEGDKWSYRIQVRGDDHVLGMRRLSIQHPGTRNYLAEWGWHENLRREGVLAPRYDFLNVVLNGAHLGIFALEEHFSKELMESQHRREGVIVTFDEEHYWDRRAQLGLEPSRFDFVHMGGHRQARIDTRRSTRVAGREPLARQRDTAVGLLRAFQDDDLPASEVFDVGLLGRYLALTELWEARHALIWNNVQFYYNPVTARLEPLSFDGQPQEFVGPGLYALVRPWTVQALKDPAVAEAYVAELDRISRPEYLEWLRGEIYERYRQLDLALGREFPEARGRRVWENLASKQQYIRRSLAESTQVLPLATSGWSRSDPTTGGSYRIDVRNLLTLPVEVIEFRMGDFSVPAQSAWTGGEGRPHTRGVTRSMLLGPGARMESDPMRYATFSVPHPPTGPPPAPREIEVVTRILGLDALAVDSVLDYPAPLAGSGPLPGAPTTEAALRRHAFLAAGSSPDRLRLRPGTWEVDEDLVLPEGMTLEAGPGTVLRFASDAVLLARGPLHFRGESGSPVVLAPRDSTWSGLVVLGAGGESHWEHVIVANTHGVDRDGWLLTGGVTFYESPLTLVRSSFLGSRAEDALNLIRTTFTFRDCHFQGTMSDAFDGDFVEGEIRNCTFRDVLGDAIDLSGSRVRIHQVAFDNIGDKGISAGEGSEVEASELVVRNALIGVASKDRSHVQLTGARISGARQAAVAAFTKKQEFGPATMRATDIDILDSVREAIVQTGSSVQLGSRLIEGSPLNVKLLYEEGLLGT